MSNYRFAEVAHFAMGLAPVANGFAGAVGSDVVNMANYGKTVFVVVTGAGAVGTATFQVEACDDVVPTNHTPVTFHYRSYDNTDVPGDLTAGAAVGFANVAGANRIHVIEVDAEALLLSGRQYVRLLSTEVVANAVLGGILIIQLDPRSTENVGQTSLV